MKGIVQHMERETKVVMHASSVVDGMRLTPAILSTLPGYSRPLTREQLRKAAEKWLSPPDPSTNHDFARNVRHKGTTTWFFQDSIFNEWKSTHSLLWIHGKRTLFLPSAAPLLNPLTFLAGSGKSTLWFVVFRSSLIRCAEIVDQLCYN